VLRERTNLQAAKCDLGRHKEENEGVACGAWCQNLRRAEKLFREKNTEKKQTSFDGFEPQANRDSNMTQTFYPLSVKGANGKNTAVSKKLVSLLTPFQSDLIP
jgi:hypothetical protein